MNIADYFEILDQLPSYEDKPEERPGTEPVYRWDNTNGVWLSASDNAGRFRYYLELPTSKGDMVKDILFDLTVTALELGENPEPSDEWSMVDLFARDFKASYSYFYGDESSRGSSYYKCYEWNGAIFCAKKASEAQKHCRGVQPNEWR